MQVVFLFIIQYTNNVDFGNFKTRNNIQSVMSNITIYTNKIANNVPFMDKVW